jgi:hypothetical protein
MQLSLGRSSEALDEQFFGLHHDLAPEEIAKQLGGTLVWKKEDQGQWIGLIRFDRRLDMQVDGAAELQAAESVGQ